MTKVMNSGRVLRLLMSYVRNIRVAVLSRALVCGCLTRMKPVPKFILKDAADVLHDMLCEAAGSPLPEGQYWLGPSEGLEFLNDYGCFDFEGIYKEFWPPSLETIFQEMDSCAEKVDFHLSDEEILVSSPWCELLEIAQRALKLVNAERVKGLYLDFVQINNLCLIQNLESLLEQGEAPSAFEALLDAFCPDRHRIPEWFIHNLAELKVDFEWMYSSIFSDTIQDKIDFVQREFLAIEKDAITRILSSVMEDAEVKQHLASYFVLSRETIKSPPYGVEVSIGGCEKPLPSDLAEVEYMADKLSTAHVPEPLNLKFELVVCNSMASRLISTPQMYKGRDVSSFKQL
ncbi:MAG: hypothetical protein ACI9LY_003656 [Arenicella sp.]|jgi:hypothetical protein